MDPIQLEDDTAAGPIKFGGRRRRAGPVFRVRGTKARSYAVAGAALGATIGGVYGAVVSAGNVGLIALGLSALLALLGFARGKGVREDKCSECEAVLPARAKRCPARACEGRIVGEIADRRDRLTAIPSKKHEAAGDDDPDDADDD